MIVAQLAFTRTLHRPRGDGSATRCGLPIDRTRMPWDIYELSQPPEPPFTCCSPCNEDTKPMTDTTDTIATETTAETNGVSAAPKRRTRRAPADAAPHETLSVTAPPSPLGALRTAIADAILHRKRLAGELSDLDAELAVAGIKFDWSASAPSATEAPAAAPPKPARKGRTSRTAKAPAEPSAILTDIVAHLRAHQDGQRAEEIRAAVGFDKADVTKALKEGLKAKLLTKSGEKRATVYRAK